MHQASQSEQTQLYQRQSRTRVVITISSSIIRGIRDKHMLDRALEPSNKISKSNFI